MREEGTSARRFEEGRDIFLRVSEREREWKKDKRVGTKIAIRESVRERGLKNKEWGAWSQEL